ncbi:MAG: dipeptidase [Deltaproteobacteria bacterium]|nr:dipeptidase [Deltaproteobacteria bacterium]
MKNGFISTVIGIFAAVFTYCHSGHSCTNFLISKGASADGSTMISYSADSHELYGELYFTASATHAVGEMLDIYEWDTGKYLGKIEQVPKTYSVVGNMNEHQVAIGETTYGGRKELKNPEGIIDYGSLMYIALQRAKTAREAIEIMGDLVAKYGYYSSGESFSISDPKEVWIMEMIGKGPRHKGAVWVARKIPDGYISAHANQARIRQFPLNDKKNCLYAEDVISFARKKGYFCGKDEEFSFADTYAPLDYGALRFCEARVYAMFNRAAPSMKLSMDFVKGVDGAKPMPLWIKPDKKLSVRDVIALMRDHFKGTDFDMTKDVGMGPYELPYRWRPLVWELDGKKYVNERATSTQQTGFSFVAQSRSWLPDPIGGVLWFSVDDTFSTVYIPMYCGMREVPKSYAVGTGSFDEFTWDSAFWVFNFVSNYAYGRYSDMIKDIQVVQREQENHFLARLPAVDKAAGELYKKAPELARDYLTEFSVKQAETTVAKWRKLGEFLIYKYLDGNMKDENDKVTHPGYPKSWYRRVVKDTGKHFEMKDLGEPAKCTLPRIRPKP